MSEINPGIVVTGVEETEIGEEDQKYPPLWMPVGSVRALIAIIVTIATAGMVFTSTSVPDWWQVVYVTMMGMYFGSRISSPRK